MRVAKPLGFQRRARKILLQCVDLPLTILQLVRSWRPDHFLPSKRRRRITGDCLHTHLWEAVKGANASCDCGLTSTRFRRQCRECATNGAWRGHQTICTTTVVLLETVIGKFGKLTATTIQSRKDRSHRIPNSDELFVVGTSILLQWLRDAVASRLMEEYPEEIRTMIRYVQ